MKALPTPLSLVLLSGLVLLGSCEEKKEPASPRSGSTAEPAPRETKKVEEAAVPAEKAGTWAELLKQKRDQGKSALPKFDIEQLRKHADGLMTSMQAGDFAGAEKSAAAFDAAMQSKVLQRTVAVMKAKTEQGNDAAQALIDSYVKLPDLGPEERKFFEGLKEKIVNSSVDDRVNFVVFAAAIACQIGLKGNGAELPFLAMELLFGEKMGILRDKYEWKNPMAK